MASAARIRRLQVSLAHAEARLDAARRKCSTGYGCGGASTDNELQHFPGERLDRRCARPDGTFYGTSGKCRKGKAVGAKAKPATRQKNAADKPIRSAAKTNTNKSAPLAKSTHPRIAKSTSPPAKADKPLSAGAPVALTRSQIKKAFAGFNHENPTEGQLQAVMAKIYAMQGFNKKPQVVESEDELRKRPDTVREKGETQGAVIYRGVTDAKYVDQFRGDGPDGETHYPGFGYYGNGTYAAGIPGGLNPRQKGRAHQQAFNTAAIFAKASKSEMRKNPEAVAQRVMAISIKADAKILRMGDSFKERAQELIEKASRIAGFKIQDPGIAAATLGYDGYEYKVTSTENHWVLFNRGATIVSKPEVKT